MTDWSPLDDVDPSAPGLVVGVTSGESEVSWASFGSDSVDGVPLLPSSLFYVASIAKQFTAAAIATLYLHDVLDLDDSVRRWLPELPESWGGIEVQHLLAHTGGLRDAGAVDVAAGWGVDSRFTTWDRVGIIATTTPDSPPGVVHRYNNHGYVLLAAIVERATGTRFGEFLEHAVLAPAGMTSSRFIDTDGPSPVSGWSGGTRRIDIQFTCCGDGGLLTTIDDLTRWNHWLPGSTLGPVMLTARPVLPDGSLAHDAWGISIRQHRGLRIESHGGSIDGYTASFVRFPTEDLAIIVLANTDQFGVSNFGDRVEELMDSLLRNRIDRSRPPWTRTHGKPLVD